MIVLLYNMEVGVGMMNSVTFLRAFGFESWNVCYFEFLVRLDDL